MNGDNKYSGIINLPHHISKIRAPMSLRDRAAQFSPFAALSGHDEALQETARLTDAKTELDEYEKQRINEKIQIIMKRLPENKEIKISFFVSDGKKSGGVYITRKVKIKKIDTFNREIITTDGTVISVNDIYDIDIPEETDRPDEQYL